MSSSSYYHLLMQDYMRSKRSFEEKKTDYNAYLKKIQNLRTDLDEAYDDLVKSETNFKDGGYVNDGVIIGQDTIKNSYQLLKNSIDRLDKVIQNTKNRIDDYINEINKYKRLYNEAKRNYENALENESAE